MTEFRFEGRVAIISGAAGGLGRAHAELLASRGAAVVIGDLAHEPAEDTAAAIAAAGGTALAVGGDVSTVEGANALITAARAQFGRIDIVVNNAGQLRASDFGEMPDELFLQMLNANLLTAFRVTRAAWPHLAEHGCGRVISTTSNSGLLGTAGSIGYASAKAALWGFTRSLALEGKPLGINVNAIAPIAYTAMSRTSRVAPASWRSGEGDPWARRLDPQRVSPVVAWLAHESNRMNSEVFTVAGGRVGRFVMGVTDGFDTDDLTIETVDARLAELQSNDRVAYYESSAAEGKALHRRLMPRT
jgi:NAD(P)-dependent dehydrogenase (short-subunit alcohol dehydrogenase family)